MSENLSFVEGLAARIDGPLALRLAIQPLVAIFFAVRDGMRDARTGQTPYFWAMFSEPAHRRELLLSGWKSVGKVFIVAIIADTIFQYLVFSHFRPLGAIITGIVLALLPYLLLRGPVNRIMRARLKHRQS